MNRLTDFAILLAAEGRWSDMSQRFRGQRTRLDLNDVLTGLLVLGGAIGVFWLVSLVIRLQDRHRTFTSPVALFLSLCKAHRLRWTQGWLLWRVARAYRLRDPAQVFVRPELFHPARLEPSLQQRASELKRLHDRLFAESPETDDESSGRTSIMAEEKPSEAERSAASSEAASSEAAPSKAASLKATSSKATRPKTALPTATSPGLPPALDIAPWPPSSGFEQETPRSG